MFTDIYMTISQASEKLNISVQALKNWIRLDKIEAFQVREEIYFTHKDIKETIEKINLGELEYLKARRNKSFKKGNSIYLNYIRNNEVIEQISNIVNKYNSLNLKSNFVDAIVVEYAIKFIIDLCEIDYITYNSYIYEYLQKKLDLGKFSLLVNIMIDNLDGSYKSNEYKEIIKSGILNFNLQNQYAKDVLGLLYISLKDSNWKKKNGVYYTPTQIVSEMVKISMKETEIQIKSAVDACCGTGNFLLNLAQEGIDISNLYGIDIDFNAVNICRLNLCLLKGSEYVEDVIRNIVCENSIYQKLPKVDLIIGNPPWISGFEIDNTKLKDEECNFFVESKNNTYDIFVEHAVRNLNQNSYICYLVPESLISTTMHRDTWKFMSRSTKIEKIIYLKRVFHEVVCPSVIVLAKKTNKYFSSTYNKFFGTKIVYENTSFEIKSPRDIDKSIVNFKMNDEVFDIINKLDNNLNCVKLSKIAKNTMGIVTGDNKNILKKNTDLGEGILIGSDIHKYKIDEASNFIDLKNDKIQQIAPIENYRKSPKLVYRFIYNNLVFACDKENRLTLNSCNILQINDSNFDIYYILGILNSTLMSYYFENKYNSKKILKKHIMNIPIYAMKHKCVGTITKLSKYLSENYTKISSEEISKYMKIIDKCVFEIYSIESECIKKDSR